MPLHLIESKFLSRLNYSCSDPSLYLADVDGQLVEGIKYVVPAHKALIELQMESLFKNTNTRVEYINSNKCRVILLP